MRTILLAVLSAGSFIHCKSLYDRNGYMKSPAAGAVTGDDWAYAYAYTDAEAKLPEGVEHIIVLKTQKPKNSCPSEDDVVKDRREVVIGIDGKLGEMAIGSSSGQYETSEDTFNYTKPRRSGTVAFLDPSNSTKNQYKFATSGKIKIIKISADLIEGMVVAKLNPGHFVNGKFKAKVCKWGQLN